MKYFVQSSDTGSYLTATGRWTADPERAYPFCNWKEANQFCRMHGIEHGDYVIEMDRLGGELRMECC